MLMLRCSIFSSSFRGAIFGGGSGNLVKIRPRVCREDRSSVKNEWRLRTAPVRRRTASVLISRRGEVFRAARDRRLERRLDKNLDEIAFRRAAACEASPARNRGINESKSS